ncbi:MAG: MGMT family protein [Candidatus Paceibacterota bacterium]
MTFREKVLAAVKKIPNGGTMSYKQVAELAGRPMAYRAVGNILHANYDPAIPCYRVVRSDGGIGGYNRGVERKKEILEVERIQARVRADIKLAPKDARCGRC